MKSHSVIQSAFILGFLASSLPAPGQPAAPAAFPAMNLGKSARGAAIISALGSRLPEVARFYGMTETALGALCLRDRDLRVDRLGKLLFACEGVPEAAAEAEIIPDPSLGGEDSPAQAPTADNAATDALLNYPDSQTFVLHSKPGASRVIYLDFNGHTTTGTQWNAAFTSGAPITTPAYDTEGTPASYSATELANIQEIWKRISEDYAPWDVDVTTEEPPVDSLRKTDALDTAYGVRVVIGGSSLSWYGAGAGGVAYLRSFSWDSDTPVFVFPTQLGNGSPKYVAEAGSHEVGHSVGLSHDGLTSGTTYYAGHGEFPNSWAPIMGNSYYSEISQFSKGEYTGANNLEDDTAIIDGYIPRSPDLAGDDILTAVPLPGPVFSATGLIQSRNDADLYRVDADAGTLNFTVTPASPEANLDIGLALYDGAGSILTSSDSNAPVTTLSAVVPAGTYYLAVDGTGFGTADSGYTDYASLGQFSLNGTLSGTVNQPPVAVVSQTTPVSGLSPLTVRFSSAGSYDPEGGPLTYDWDFGNGVRSSLANPQYIYTTPGTYTASLVVFDNGNLSSAASILITVAAVPPIGPKVLYVTDIAMSKTVSSKGTTAKAIVTVKDGTGALRANAVVSGTWSGLTVGTKTAKTSSKGLATFTSATTKNNGTFQFKVNSITLSGFTYDATKNVETTDSIVK